MKKLILASMLLMFGMDIMAQQQYQFLVVSSIESIVPMGLGRSRLLVSGEEVNYEDFTTERTAGTDSDQGKVRRKDIRIDELEETKLLNFYSAIGINFQNIASNDAVLSSMLTKMSSDGWELFSVTSGVESDAGGDDGNGLFITRYIFRRPVN